MTNALLISICGNILPRLFFLVFAILQRFVLFLYSIISREGICYTLSQLIDVSLLGEKKCKPFLRDGGCSPTAEIKCLHDRNKPFCALIETSSMMSFFS